MRPESSLYSDLIVNFSINNTRSFIKARYQQTRVMYIDKFQNSIALGQKR